MSTSACMDHLYSARNGRSPRSTTGCWTCKLRRKKCDEQRPVCAVCSALRITCHYGQEKPEWLDGGAKQKAMVEQIKLQIKTKGHYRYGVQVQGTESDRISNHSTEKTDQCQDTLNPLPQGVSCNNTVCNDPRRNWPLEPSASILLTFYLDHVFPFLYPFYDPGPLEGGKAWILELMLSRPVVRQAILCQSSYFFLLARKSSNGYALWESVLTNTRDAFEVLRQALEIIHHEGVKNHLPGAVRVLTGIIQIQRFEIAISSFENCQAHLDAAVNLFFQLNRSVQTAGLDRHHLSFDAIMKMIAQPTEDEIDDPGTISSAEQSAFCFSSSLLVFDDIIASTVLQEDPQLHEYHQSLLQGTGGQEPYLHLEEVIGCHNSILLQIAAISTLEAWKKRRRKAGDLDVVDLVRRAQAIRDSLESLLLSWSIEPPARTQKDYDFLDLFQASRISRPSGLIAQSALVSRIWTHAAHLYLHVVVSGWQPAHPHVRHHVGQVIALIGSQISRPTLLRTVVWPFCVAGCLAEPDNEPRVRYIMDSVHPASVMRTLGKAFEIIENAWSTRYAESRAVTDFATRFRIEDELILLV